MNPETLELFKTLTELPGTSGFEHEVRKFMRKELSKYVDEIVQDGLGSIFGVRYGEQDDPVIMVSGHMDEVGFLVVAITEQGMIRFQPLGGWSPQVVQAQRVQVFTEQGPIPGVISSIPPHLLRGKSDKNKVAELKDLLIDIGADNKEDAIKMGVKPGQQIVPVCPFTPMANPKKIMAKAWDNRYGCGLAIELLKEVHGVKLPNTLYSGATVQEEVGLRGARTSAYMIKPDLFLHLMPVQQMI